MKDIISILPVALNTYNAKNNNNKKKKLATEDLLLKKRKKSGTKRVDWLASWRASVRN